MRVFLLRARHRRRRKRRVLSLAFAEAARELVQRGAVDHRLAVGIDGLEVITDTQGVDFTVYLQQVQSNVKRNGT